SRRHAPSSPGDEIDGISRRAQSFYRVLREQPSGQSSALQMWQFAEIPGSRHAGQRLSETEFATTAVLYVRPEWLRLYAPRGSREFGLANRWQKACIAIRLNGVVSGQFRAMRNAFQQPCSNISRSFLLIILPFVKGRRYPWQKDRDV